MNIKELMEKNEWTRTSPSLRDDSGKPINTCSVCQMPETQKVHDPECWLGLGLELLRAADVDTKIHIGWYNPGEQRFCYDDVKETSPKHHASYTVPVFAHLDSTVDKLKRQIRELRSELEGKTDAFNEALFQLKVRMRNTLEWMVTDLIASVGESGYTPKLTEAISLLAELQQ